MLGPNLRLVFAACAAVAVGLVGGWTTLALMQPRAPAMQQPADTAPAQVARASIAGLTREESASPPAPASPAPASSTEKPATRERNAAPSGPTGVWIDHTGRGAVEISECSGGLCGRIVWLKDAGHKSVCGKQIIGNAKRTSAGTWDGGWIYDPDKEARYSVELKLMNADRLRVMGYMGSKLFSETYTWKRATADLSRCDAPAATASPLPAADDAKSAPVEITKADPSADQTPDTAPASKSSKSKNPGMADIEKFAREMMKGKAGGKDCTVKLPYVGTVTVPCGG
jgi:uncharacterized protein (DUF2147 family)